MTNIFVNESDVSQWKGARDKIQQQAQESQRSRDEQIARLQDGYHELLKNNSQEIQRYRKHMEQQIADIMAAHQKEVNKEQAALQKLEQDFLRFLKKREQLHKEETAALLLKNEQEIALHLQQERNRRAAEEQQQAGVRQSQEAIEARQRLEAQQIQELLDKQEANRLERERLEKLRLQLMQEERERFQTQMEEILKLQQKNKMEMETRYAAQLEELEEVRQRSIVLATAQAQTTEATQKASTQSLSKTAAIKQKYPELIAYGDQFGLLCHLFSNCNKKLQKAVENFYQEFKSGETPLNFQLHPGCSEVCPLIAFLQGADGNSDSPAQVIKCEGHQVDYLFRMDFTDQSKMKVVSFAPHVANN